METHPDTGSAELALPTLKRLPSHRKVLLAFQYSGAKYLHLGLVQLGTCFRMSPVRTKATARQRGVTMFGVIQARKPSQGTALTLTSINTRSCRPIKQSTTNSKALWDPAGLFAKCRIGFSPLTGRTQLFLSQGRGHRQKGWYWNSRPSNQRNRPFVPVNRATFPPGAKVIYSAREKNASTGAVRRNKVASKRQTAAISFG